MTIRKEKTTWFLQKYEGNYQLKSIILSENNLVRYVETNMFHNTAVHDARLN